MTLEEKQKQTITIFGEVLPKWQDCTRCGDKLACMFYENVGYYQPCEKCRKSPEYRKELDNKVKDDQKRKSINTALENRKPAAYHRTPWNTYLVTNKSGDVIREEKIGAVESTPREKRKAKLRSY